MRDVTRLGRSPEAVRRLAFGCEQLGGHAWGTVEPHEIERAIELAVERGIRIFDTADCYGRGESERRLARALAPHRSRVLVATKFGVRFGSGGKVYYDSSPEWAEQALTESLQRLGGQSVDLFQMHYWDGITPMRALLDKLEKLREQSRIRWYGLTNYVPSAAELQYPGLVSASLEYSIAQRAAEETARRMADAGITFLSYGSLGQGVLSGKYRSPDCFGEDDRRSRAKYRNLHGATLTRNLRIVHALTAEARAQEVTPAQVAIAWILHKLPASIPLVGIKRPDQLRDVLGALELKLGSAALAAIDRASAISDSEVLPT
ncbi:MAG: aldo/keto reductase [Steroidobacteraceae bacterium]